MATDKKGRKLPKGIRQRYDEYEGRFMHEGQEYLVQRIFNKYPIYNH